MVDINGALSMSRLRATANGVELTRETWNAFEKMRRLCLKKTGADLWLATPYGGYRDLEAQKHIANGSGGNNPQSTIPAAGVGFSTHGWGNRIDIGSFGGQYGDNGTKRERWLLSQAHRFGFTREFGPADPNHFKHDGVTEIGPVPPITTEEIIEEIMTGTAHLKSASGAQYLAHAFGLELIEPSKYNTFNTAFGDPVSITQAQRDSIQEQLTANRTAFVNQIRDAVLAGIPAATGSFTSADRAKLDALPGAVDNLPTNGELGQALTGTVNLVNQTAAVNRDLILQKIDQTHGAGGAAFSGPLQVTLSGTATPASTDSQ
jgi:hypothetical protein